VGNRTAIVDARNNLRTFHYDAADQQVQALDPLGNLTEWFYDAGGQLSLRLDPRSTVDDTEFEYDDLGRPTLRWAEDLGAVTAAYDARGQRVRSEVQYLSIRRVDYRYDPLGHLTQVQAPDTGTVAYSYDARGQRTQLDYPNGGPALQYAYWPDGQLKVVTDTTTLASYSYDTVGRLATVTRANGATTTYSYDDADRLTDLHTTVGGTTRSRFQYTLDRLGQRTAVTETLGLATRAITYAYDGLQRLSSAGESPGTLYDYAYDNAGNRTGVWVNGSQVTSQTYNAADEVVGYTYDAASNLTDDGTHTYAYDPLNHLVQRDATSYTDDADGVLAAETTGGSTISYTQDLASPLSQILQTVQGGTTTDHLYGLERLASEASGTRTWYGSDALGSVRQTLNSGGTVLGSVDYDSWGQLESGATPGFGFTGEMQDSVGMVYLRARWYNPTNGTFTARDPFEGYAELPYSQHPYQYAYSNPVLHTDPSGKVVPGVCPIGYIAVYKDGQFAGCEDNPNFPEWLWFLKGSFGPLPVGGVAAGGTLPQAGGQAAGKAIEACGTVLAYLLGQIVQTYTQAQVRTNTQQRSSQTVAILGPGTNFPEIWAIALLHPGAQLKAVDNDAWLALQAVVGTPLLPPNVSVYKNIHDIPAEDADYAYLIFPDAGGEAVFPGHIPRILKSGGTAVIVTENQARAGVIASKLQRSGLIVTEGSIKREDLLAQSGFASDVNYSVLAKKP
jgi:RHS repeat-associated protein